MRNCVLEVLHRLPVDYPEVEPYAGEMVDLLMELVRVENEENAVLCMKTIMDLERRQIAATADRVQPFLELIQEIFEAMGQVVKETFDIPAQGGLPGPSGGQHPVQQSPRPGSPGEMGGEHQASQHLIRGMQSFKVLAECPIIVVTIFQTHRASVPHNVKVFVPAIKGILLLQAKPQERAHAEADAKGTVFTGVAKEIKNRAAFGEFITAQVKTMSFLAYLIRMYANQLQDFLPSLPGVVVRLLQDCPREKSSARKELLVAIRHIINFNYRKIFLEKIDDLLDERTLIGDGLTVYETMRPLAYSMLADLIHHVRESLNRNQIRRTVEVYTKNLHDDFPGTSFQTMSARLLSNMAPQIANLPDKNDARFLLIMILDAVGDKFATINYQFDSAVKISGQQQKSVSAIDDSTNETESKPEWDEIDIFSATPIKISNPRDRNVNPVEDNTFLFANLVKGLKGFFFELKRCSPGDLRIEPTLLPVNWNEVTFGFNAEEVRVIQKLFHEGARVFRYYGVGQPEPEVTNASPLEFLSSHPQSSISAQEKELLEMFGTIFHCIDTATFHEIFHSEIPHLHELMFEHGALLHLPQFFLASEATSPAFAGMVLQYLMDRIEDVGTDDATKSRILLRMFKLSFMAVNLFSEQNEQVLHPHIAKIVTKCLQLSVSAKEPMNYFILLRSLFRSIGGGRFELLYKEILPLLEMLLETFNHLLLGARKQQERDLYVELTLTVPARLSYLLPHLSHLMRPIVVALRSGSELVGQGLRTLELCVDNLAADYLDPIMAPIMDDLMAALWSHLRPSPYVHFNYYTTMKILGKLGGRNRKFLNHPPELSFEQYVDDSPSIDIKLLGSNKDRAFPLAIGVDLAFEKLLEVPRTSAGKASDLYYKQKAYHLLSSQLKMYIGFEYPPDDLASLIRLHANDLASGDFDGPIDILDQSERQDSVVKRHAQEQTLRKLLKACIIAAGTPSLKQMAEPFLADVCRHLMVIDVGRTLAHSRHLKRPFSVSSGEGPLYLDPRVLAEAVVECLSSDDSNIRDSAKGVIHCVRDAAEIIFGSPDKIWRLTFFNHLSRTFCHACYSEEWFTKAGGSLGINLMTTELNPGENWLRDRQAEFVRALMYVVKDTPTDLSAGTRKGAEETLGFILQRYNKGVSKDDLKNDKSRIFGLCAFLVFELAHMSKYVRALTKKAFGIIAKAIGVEVWELVAPVKEKLLRPIFNKPLRALPFPTQIGFIDAITYCLALHNGVVPFNDQLHRLLMESLALVDAEDEALAPKPFEFKTAEQIISFRVSCLRLLSMAMSFPEFANGPQNTARARVVSVFFKFLYSRSPEIIEAANAGLKDVLTQTNKLPKDLLQNGLRPILMNLQDPKRLSVPGLDGLARLLTLLTSYFKVEIGSRLLDHMKHIADDFTLQRVSFGLLEQSMHMRIVTAIFNIFHLLPSAATCFMERLVNKILDLESRLRRTIYSPFRAPLVKYLNRYPKESWAFFQAHFNDERYGRFFGQILADPASEPLRQCVVADTDTLIRVSFGLDPNATNRTTSMINAIYVVHSACSYDATKTWLKSHPQLKQMLLDTGRELEGKLKADALPLNEQLRAEQAADQLMEIITIYLTQNPGDLDFLFSVISAVSQREIKSTIAFPKFLYSCIITSESIDYRRSVINRCLDEYAQRNQSRNMKTYAFHNLVNPIFAQDVQNNWGLPPTGPRLMDKKMTEAIHERIWKSQLGDISDESNQPGIDHLRMELLQLSALVIKYHHAIFQETRKEIIKFAWSYIRLEDIINKYGAYVLISYFILYYETPQKIVIQIYVTLLRAHQNEGKTLVTQALDILAPVLPKRAGDSGNARYPPIWVRLARKILAEETANLQQVMSIFHFLVRHPDLFYSSRENFAALIISSLNKIAAPSPSSPNPTSEAKRLALNLIALIWKWEGRRVSEASLSPSTKKRKLDEASGASTVTPNPLSRPEYQVQHPLRLSLIKFLVTFICTQERFPVPAAKLTVHLRPPPSLYFHQSVKLVEPAMKLLSDFLSPTYWGDVDIGLYPKSLVHILASEKADKPDDKMTSTMINALWVLRIILASKPDQWILANLPAIQELLEKPLRSDNPEIAYCLHGDDVSEAKVPPPVKRVLDALPADSQEDEDSMDVDNAAPSEFVVLLNAVGSDGLSSNNQVSALNTLWTLSKCRPVQMDQHIPQIMKALSYKAKDHVTEYSKALHPQTLQAALRSGEYPPIENPEFKIGVDLIPKAIDSIASRMSQLGEQRRPFLSIIGQLIERSQDRTLCCKILDMTESWIFKSTESWPTLKEKTAVLLKMLVFENRIDQVPLKRFLDLIIRIYEDPQITKTDLTVRLEQAFLIGTRAQDVEMRNRFISIFDRSLTRSPNARLNYILLSQNWETLKDSFWLAQASHLIIGSLDMTTPARLHPEDFTVYPTTFLYGSFEKDPRQDSVMVDSKLEAFVAERKKFCQEIGEVKTVDILEPLSQLQHTDASVAYKIWVTLFNICWASLPKDERFELEKGMVTLLTRPYHHAQLDDRPNVIQALLEGAVRAKPRFKLPPHVMKFLSRTYDAWYIVAMALEESAISPVIDTPKVRESNLDALVEIYAGLQEEDLFYGTWRRRCKFVETNAALSYEQNGMWERAQQLYELAQIKARTGAVPFSPAEYYLWEDHWIICAEKLQQWDILSDFAKHENFNDLLLESTWRNIETWQVEANREQIDSIIKSVSDAPTPRRLYFQAFMSLLKFHAKQETPQEFHSACDDAIQLTIRKWHQLPKRITNAHIPILEHFQLLVELNDASNISNSLSTTNAGNLDTKSAELKLLLGAWRDRLPNVWDDINAWQDLVTWRQHIFQMINQTYLGLVQPQASNAANNSYAYRGYHETAWIINRFAHVARKHQILDVSINQLSRIYTLPNIEIQEAFLKLREQAKCLYQNSRDIQGGLEVINNTNLNYFNAQQKAEFYTLKGMFLAKMNLPPGSTDANDAFGIALHYELRLAKAWAEWGQYSDGKFKQDPTNMELANNAVSCYLQAAGLYKNHKSRKLLSRILWLLSLDSEEGKIAHAFETFDGETPVWYWITFIPQLLTSLSQREARLAKAVLQNIAKLFPQSLFFLLRTSREDMLGVKKQYEQKLVRVRQAAAVNGAPVPRPDEGANGVVGSHKQLGQQSGQQPGHQPGQQPGHPGTAVSDGQKETPKKPWEYCEDVMAGLKTAFPLLALSMETMVDQIHNRFKCPPDEDAYRLIVALLNDGLAYVGRMPTTYARDGKLPPATEANITRFAETILPVHLRTAFEADFVVKKPTMFEYIHKLRRWRDKFEEKLDRRPTPHSLEAYSANLSEFKFCKFDDVEVPGQYLEHKDTNKDFVRIDHFLPDVDLVRSIGVCHRRLKIRGHDGSMHTFAVQHPAARHCRREERILQLFRIFNWVLAKRTESRRRNLYFHLPLMVPLASHIRLVQDDPSYISLQAVYEDHCRRVGMSKDEPVLFTMEKMRDLFETRHNVSVPGLLMNEFNANFCSVLLNKPPSCARRSCPPSKSAGCRTRCFSSTSSRSILASPTSSYSVVNSPTNTPPWPS